MLWVCRPTAASAGQASPPRRHGSRSRCRTRAFPQRTARALCCTGGRGSPACTLVRGCRGCVCAGPPDVPAGGAASFPRDVPFRASRPWNQRRTRGRGDSTSGHSAEPVTVGRRSRSNSLCPGCATASGWAGPRRPVRRADRSGPMRLPTSNQSLPPLPEVADPRGCKCLVCLLLPRNATRCWSAWGAESVQARL